MRLSRLACFVLLAVLSLSLAPGAASPVPPSGAVPGAAPAAPMQESGPRTLVYTVGLGLLARFDAAVIDSVWQASPQGYARDVLHDRLLLPGISSDPVDFDFTLDGRRVYVPEPVLNRVAVIDTVGPMTVLGTVPVGPWPVDVAIGPPPGDPPGHPGYGYVTNKNNVGPSGSISVIDTATDEVIVTVTDLPGQGPSGIDVAPDGSRIYVMLITGWPTYGEVWVMETTAILDESLWYAGQNTVSADRLLAEQRVAVFGMNQANMQSGAIGSGWPGFSRITVTPDGTSAWFAVRQSVLVINSDAAYLKQLSPIYDAKEVGFAPDQSLAYLVGGSFGYVDFSWDGGYCSDPGWYCTLWGIPYNIPGGASVAFGPDGNRAYVLKHHIGGFGLAVLDTATHTRVGYVGSDTGYLGTYTVRVAREAEGPPANSLPIADAGPDQLLVECAGPEGTVVTLNGSGSSDADGEILSYLWREGTDELGTGALLDVALPEGLHTMTLTVMDDQGEQASDDVLVEVLPCPVNSAPVADAGGDRAAACSGPNGTGVLLDGSGSFDPDDDPLTYWWTGGFGSTNVGPTATVSLGMGDHVITLVVNDGSEDSAPDELIVTVADDTPPVLSGIPAPFVIAQEGPDGTLRSSVDLSTATSSDACDGDLPVTDDAPAVFPPGDTLVTFTAIDAAGNTVTAATTVTVQDSQPPVMTGVPGPITVEANTAGGAVIELGSPSAIDEVDGLVGVASDAPAVFPVGETVVTFTATDVAGNATTATVTVIVQDTTAPTMESPPGVPPVEATGSGGATVDYASPGAVDTADPDVSVSCVPASGSVFPIGETTVNCTATDSSGNGATGSFTIDVVDTTPPEIAAPPNVAVEATGPNGATLNYSLPTAVDAVSGDVAVSCDPPPGSSFPLGTTVITCTASDGLNESVITFTATVQDTIAPNLVRLVASPEKLWPPNHKMVEISVTPTASDIADDRVACRVSLVSSNEPDDGLGDGDTAPDWQYDDALRTGDLTLELRSERSGGGSGRIYTITVECVDESLNVSPSLTVAVKVPHDKGKK